MALLFIANGVLHSAVAHVLALLLYLSIIYLPLAATQAELANPEIILRSFITF